jgi:hypothetical protein
MLNKNRTVTSLKEDFERIGLLKESKEMSAPASSKIDVVESQQLTEGAEPTETPTEGELTERLAVQRLKRRPASARAKSRLSYRKKKAKIRRKRKIRSRKSVVKRKMKRLKALKRGRSAGIRRRFRLATGLEQFANLIEQLQNSQITLAEGVDNTEMIMKALESIEKMSAQMAEHFDEIETFMEDQELVELAEELMSLDDLEEACSDDMDEEDDMDDEDEDSEEVDESTELDTDEPVVTDEVETEEGDVHMGEELRNLHAESVSIMDQMKKSVLSPSDAMAAMNDMLKYLSGAMKMYMDLAKEMNVMSNEYVGQGAPKENPVSVGDKEVKPHIGQAAPPPVGESPVDSSKTGKA